MPRPPRVEFEGALYHVITRGNNRQTVFKDDDDDRKFLSLLEREKQKHPFYLYAYVLMTNHVHLLVERQSDRLSGIMKTRGQACELCQRRPRPAEDGWEFRHHL